MAKKSGRRNFLKGTVAACAGAALGLGSFEEKNLLAATSEKIAASKSGPVVKGLAMGKIGDVKVSRLICGGNLISGHAHDRDLVYVSSLLRHYFTDEKVWETFQICEENGINTAIVRVDDHCIGLLNKYWKQVGGKIQWIAQVKPTEDDLLGDVKRAIDNGAIGIYLQGERGDQFAKTGKFDLIARVLEFAKDNKVLKGIGSHSLQCTIECEMLGLDPDFYMKTLHDHSYWSCTPEEVDDPYDLPPYDNMWAGTPTKTIEFMKTVEKPWIAFKVLAAGAIRPRKGFEFAFNGGADFACVGMFDYQVKEDVKIAKSVIANVKRQRPWRG